MPSAELRVLQLIPLLALGGLETVALRLTLELAERVDRVAVAGRTGLPDSHGAPAIEGPLRDAGIPVYHLASTKPRPHVLFRAGVALAPVLRGERPDVIHAHNPSAGATAAIARQLANRPEIGIVTTYHGVAPERLGLATRAMALASDVVVGVSPAATTALRAAGLRPERSATILNAVDVEPQRPRSAIRAELGIPDDAEIVVTVGRYAPEKNQALLLDALALLAPTRPNVYALIVGHGILEGDLRDRVAHLGLERAHITGPRFDAIDVMAACDVFALSSDSEGFPLALLEAMSVGLPVVTTDVGGVRDAVADGVNGLVVPARDAQALADALTALLDHPGRGAELGAAAKRFVAEHCSVQAMVDGYLELYSDVASPGRRRATARRAGASPSK